MSTDAVTLAAIADAGAVLDVLADFAATIDFTASVADNTSSTGAVTMANVAGLSILDDIATARDDLAQLVAVPADLASTLVTLIQDFQSTAVDFLAIADTEITWASSIPAAGLSSDQIITNRTALANFLSFQGLIEAVRTTASTTYDSQDAALTVRDDLADRLDDAMMTTSSRSLRATLDALRVAMVTDINTRAATLDSLEVYTPARVLPALVLAHMLYDDPTTADDICARNAVEHPGFVPATQLTVLAP